MALIPRAQWGMPGRLGPRMRLPAARLYLHHSVTARANGAGAVRHVANIGIQRFGRASYSYACTPDGTLYEMQGDRIGAHVAGQNSTSLGVVLVGNYEVSRPTSAQVHAVPWLYRHLVATGRLRVGAPLLGHRDAPRASTACPGRHAYAVLGQMRALIIRPPDRPPFEEDDMPDEATFKRWVQQAVRAELNRVSSDRRSSRTQLHSLMRRAVRAELGDTPNDTLGRIVRRFEREISHSGGRLHQALDTWADDREGGASGEEPEEPEEPEGDEELPDDEDLLDDELEDATDEL
jgi:hypothetical protein